jgi:hypothetical protein
MNLVSNVVSFTPVHGSSLAASRDDTAQVTNLGGHR